MDYFLEHLQVIVCDMCIYIPPKIKSYTNIHIFSVLLSLVIIYHEPTDELDGFPL